MFGRWHESESKSSRRDVTVGSAIDELYPLNEKSGITVLPVTCASSYSGNTCLVAAHVPHVRPGQRNVDPWGL